MVKNDGDGANRPLSRDEGVEELCGNLTVRPHPKIWSKIEKKRVKNSSTERFRGMALEKLTILKRVVFVDVVKKKMRI